MKYIDTSVLVSYYCPEKLSLVADKAIKGLRQPVISTLSETEFCSALSMKVRTAHLSAPDATIIFDQFRAHVSNGYYRQVELGEVEFRLARNWLLGFTTSLRALDALHLAAAFNHKVELLTADVGLDASARRLGVPCRLLTV